MKKKLLALAIAGAFVAPVAMADTSNVNVYGQANVSYARLDNGSQGAVQGTNASHISSEASRIGLKGSEDLGGGTSAIWQIESQVNIDNSAANNATGSGGFGTRNTFAGLSGESWGSLVLGRNDSTYKTAFRGLDVFADTVADNRNLMGLGALDSRNIDSATYTSPSMSGFKIAAQVAAAAEAATASGATKGSIYNLSGAYNTGPIYAALAWTEIKAGSVGTGTAGATGIVGLFPTTVDDRISAWRLGGGYTVDAFAVNAIYERVSSNIGAVTKTDTLRDNIWYLAGKYNVSGSDAVKLAYTHVGDIGSPSATNTSVKQWSVGYDHSMSKRTMVYALYTRINNSLNSTVGFNNPDASTATTGIAGAGTITGASASAFALGMKHSF